MEKMQYQAMELTRVLHIAKIYSFHYYEYAPHYCGVEESHDFWEMVYVDGGSILCYAGDRRVRLSQGQALFHPPGETHNIHALGGVSNTCILSFACAQLDKKAFTARVFTLSASQRDIIAQIYHEGRALLTPPYNQLRQDHLEKRADAPYGAEEILRNFLENLIILVVRDLCDVDAKSMSGETAQDVVRRSHHTEKMLADKVEAIMRRHLYSRLTMEDICRETAFSRSRIQTVFKKQTGYSVFTYFNKLKIDQAKRLIGAGRYTFTQISAMLGFSSMHYFSRVFRAFVKMSPTEYERSVKLQALL